MARSLLRYPRISDSAHEAHGGDDGLGVGGAFWAVKLALLHLDHDIGQTAPARRVYAGAPRIDCGSAAVSVPVGRAVYGPLSRRRSRHDITQAI